ncbi:MAG: GDSL-type esterase/lipase family protein [Sedimentisphaerales bacterium]
MLKKSMRKYLILFVIVVIGLSGRSSAQSLLAKLDSGQNQIIVTIGTSLTGGTGGAWVAQMYDWLLSEYPGQVTLYNCGVGGSSSYNSDPARNGLGFLPGALAYNPDVVFVEYAMNDAYSPFNMSVQQSRNNLNTIIDQILAHNPNAEIILETMNSTLDCWRDRHAGIRPNLALYYQMYREVAQERGFLLIDHYPNWLNLMAADMTAFWDYVPDGIHPNAAGGENIILPMVKKTLLAARCDFDDNQKVDMSDLAIFVEQWLKSGTSGRENFNEDANVNAYDFNMFAAQWGWADCCVNVERLAAHWKLDESDGLIASDSTGNHPGTLYGNPVWQPTGGNDDAGALLFDGTNDYIEIIGYKGVTDSKPSTPRTCTAWIKGAGDIISWGTAATGKKWLFRTGTAGKLQLDVGNCSITGTKNVADGQWHHIAVVSFGDKTDYVRFYVDGAEDTISSFTSMDINTAPDNNVKLGYSGSGGTYFSGLLDDVRVYDRFLGVPEIFGWDNASIPNAIGNPRQIYGWSTCEAVSVRGSDAGFPGRELVRSIDGSGLDTTTALLHGKDHLTMAICSSVANPRGGTINDGTYGNRWVEYSFDQIYNLDKMELWSAQQNGDWYWSAQSVKDVYIQYSTTGGTDPAEWTAWGAKTFVCSPVTSPSPADNVVNFVGVPVKYVVITLKNGASGTWIGQIPGSTNYDFAIAEVRFYKAD